MLTIDQLMYFDRQRDEYNTQIGLHNDAIFQAQQTIVSEQQNIAEVKAKHDTMIGILNQVEPGWEDRLSASGERG